MAVIMKKSIYKDKGYWHFDGHKRINEVKTYVENEEYIKKHSPEACEAEKTKKQKKLKDYIVDNAKKYNIKQATIWSLTDSTNFLLDKKNKSLIEQGKKPMKSIYGGAFRTKKTFDYRATDEMQVYQQIKEKNYLEQL